MTKFKNLKGVKRYKIERFLVTSKQYPRLAFQLPAKNCRKRKPLGSVPNWFPSENYERGILNRFTDFTC
jgi:hypothetical protein